MNLIVAPFVYAALTLLALAMAAHHRAFFKREITASARWRLRVSGWALLATSFGAAVGLRGWEMGAVSWLATVACSGFALTLLLSYAPRWCVLPVAGLLLIAAI